MRTPLVVMMLVSLSLATLLIAQPASACERVTPPNGAGGIYQCGGGRIEVRSSGTVAATGPTSGTGWYVTLEPIGGYVAADASCFGGWCYYSAAAFPVGSLQLRHHPESGQFAVCPNVVLSGCLYS